MPMPVTLMGTDLPGVLLVKTGIAADDRGAFAEAYTQSSWNQVGIKATFIQDNLSWSHRGTLRGMHYQLEPHGLGKLVRAVAGSVFDVAVDLRRGSPTYGRWTGQLLTANSNTALWIPDGFAHGFLALEDNSLVWYKVTGPYVPEAERTLSYRDPKVGIAWPIPPVHISARDENAPGLDAVEKNFVYTA